MRLLGYAFMHITKYLPNWDKMVYLGVFFFFGYLVSLFRFIWKRKGTPSFNLAIAIFFLYVSLMLTQGGMWFELDVFMVLVFLKIHLEQKIYLKSKQMLTS